MKLIADANILFSLAKPSSASNGIVAKYRIKLYSPEYVLSELEEHGEELAEKAGQPYDNIMSYLAQRVAYIESKEYDRLMGRALRLTKDSEDAPYLALAMKFRIPVWSNDKHLKEQEKIPVFTTKELIELLTTV
jgi:predicted nucleic acid-binding protein